MNILNVYGNEYGRIVVKSSGDSFKVDGTGMIKPRLFPTHQEAIEFAQDKLLMVTLEAEQTLNEQLSK